MHQIDLSTEANIQNHVVSINKKGLLKNLKEYRHSLSTEERELFDYSRKYGWIINPN